MLYNLTLLLPCAMCLIGAIWLLCKGKSNTKAQNILALCFLLSSVFFLCTANYIAGVSDYVAYMKWDMVDSFATLLVIPTMYLYFRSMTHEGQFTWKDYIWFFPALFVGIGTSVLYFAMDKTEVVGYVKSVLIDRTQVVDYSETIYKLHRFISVELYNLTALIQILGAGTCAVINLRGYHRRLREFYSDMDDKSMDTDNKILFWFLLTIPLAVGIIGPKRTFWEGYPILASLYFMAWTAVYFALLYYGSQKKYTVENLARDIEQADFDSVLNNYDLSEENEEDMGGTIEINKYTKYLQSFQKLIEEDHIFLQSDLRADEVAAKIYTNRTYLSRMLKEELKCTFSDYINQKRIEYAQKLMHGNPNIKLAELADKSGFSNINSFGRTFKQIAGVPPKEWLKNSVPNV